MTARTKTAYEIGVTRDDIDLRLHITQYPIQVLHKNAKRRGGTIVYGAAWRQVIVTEAGATEGGLNAAPLHRASRSMVLEADIVMLWGCCLGGWGAVERTSRARENFYFGRGAWCACGVG
jgi:hypothetical protein